MKNVPPKKILYALAGAAAVAVAYLFLFGGEKGEIRYATEKVSRGEITSLVRASATLRPTRETRIYAEISGTVTETLALANDPVSRGQTLALIDDPEGLSQRAAHFRAVLEKTRTDLGVAADSHSANERLYEKQLISKEEFERSLSEKKLAVALNEKAKADLEAAEKRLEHTRVVSNLDGVVLEQNVTPGQRIRPKDKLPLYVLAEDLRSLHLVSDVSEADIGKVARGQKVSFRVDAFAARTFGGEVVRVANSPRTRNDVVTYNVTCLVENPALELKPGMTAEARIVISTKKDALRIPTAALRFIPPKDSSAAAGGGQTVWTIRGGRLEAVGIEPGISDDSYTEVAGGPLSEGDEVVTEYSFSGKDSKSPGFALPQPKRF